jgi:hypothetical protein
MRYFNASEDGLIPLASRLVFGVVVSIESVTSLFNTYFERLFVGSTLGEYAFFTRGDSCALKL